MTKLFDQIRDGAIRLLDQHFERAAKLRSQVGRYSHRVPIPFGILLAKSIPFSLGQIFAACEAVPFRGQELRASHDRQSFLRIESCSSLHPRISDVVLFVPMRGLSLGQNFRLPVLLTFVNRFLLFPCPFSLCEFGLRRRPMWTTLCSVATRLPGRFPTSGLFSAKSFRFPNALGPFCC